MLTKTDLSHIQKIVNAESKKVITQELKSIKEDVSQTRKDTKTLVNFFDKEYLELRKRIERLEKHLQLSPLS
jgi:hypothetical protein